MRNTVNTFILFVVVLVIASFVSTGCAKNRVETIQQCYQFTVDQTNDCQAKYKEKNGDIDISVSTWLVKWGEGKNDCKVEVFAGYGDEMTCENVKKSPLEELKDFKIFTNYRDIEKDLSDALVPDKECGEIWLRFVDDYGCNYQIIWIGGIPFKI